MPAHPSSRLPKGNKEFYVLAAVRAASDSRGVLTPHTVPRTLFRYACSASCFASVAKQFPKEADELFAAAQENAQRRKDYPTHARARKWVIRDARRMCAYMGNTVYAIRCVCLWIMVGGGHTAFGQFRSKSNNRPWKVPTHLMKRERKSSTNQPRTE